MRAGRVDLAPGYLSDLEGERAFIVVAIERRDVVVALAREVSELVTRMNGPGHKSTSLLSGFNSHSRLESWPISL